MTSQIIYAVLQVFGVFAVGWFCRHRRYIDERDISRLSALTVDILYPMFIFHAIVKGFATDQFRELWPLPVIGFGLMALGALFGYLFKLGVKSEDPEVVKIFHHFCCTNNFGFLPIVITQNLWEDHGVERGLAMLFLLNLGSQVAYWTIGIGLLGQSNLRQASRQLVTPTLVSLMSALVICLLGWQRFVPEIGLRICNNAGAAAIPLQLLIIGASLYPLPKLADRRDLLYLTVIRLLYLPTVLVCLLLLLPLTTEVRNTGIVVALMPVSVSTVIIARRYGGCPDFAARAALVTTLVSMATIPLFMALLHHFDLLS